MDLGRNIDTVGPATLFTEQQKEVLVALPWLAGLVSTFSSLAIIYTLFVDKEEKKSSPFRRILFGASCVDIITSGTMVVMGGWAVPQDGWTTSLFANGNILSCNIQGFLLIYGQGAQMMYWASLALYHLVVVRYQWSNKRIAAFFEPALHTVSFIIPMLYTILTLEGDYINSSHLEPGTCGPQTYPPNCLHYPEIDCIRGHQVSAPHTISLIAFLSIVGLIWIVVLASIVLVWQAVRATESRMRRHGTNSCRATDLVMTKKVGVQGSLFVGSFVLSNIFSIIRLLVLYPLFETSGANQTLYFWIQAFSLPLVQLQGFFHAIIYLQPRWTYLVRPGRAWERFSFQPRKADGWEVSTAEELKPTAHSSKKEQGPGIDDDICPRILHRLSFQMSQTNLSQQGFRTSAEFVEPAATCSSSYPKCVVETEVMLDEEMGESEDGEAALAV